MKRDLIYYKSLHLLISTGGCRACWVKNWGEVSSVSIVKKHVRKKWRRFVFTVRYVVRQDKKNNFLSKNFLKYNGTIILQIA